MAEDTFKRRDVPRKAKMPLVLYRSELKNLIENSQMLEHEKSLEDAKKSERKKHQLSAKLLNDTIANRKEPGSDVRARQYEQEERSAHQDLKTEAGREARRNYVLDLAYKRLFEETDRVKAFKAAKNYAEMLKDREEQKKAKESMQDGFDRYDAKFVVEMLRDIDKHRDEQREKVEKIQRDKTKNAENWMKQRNEAYRKEQERKWEHLRDGYLVRDAAMTYDEEMKNKAERAKMVEMEHKRSIDDQIRMKQEHLSWMDKLDEAEEKRRKLFNDTKNEIKLQHQQLKAELDQKKDGLRKYVADTLRDETANIKAKEEQILQKAIREKEAKRKEDIAIKRHDHEKAMESIQKFYEKELETKHNRKLDARRQAFRERRQILDKVEQLEEVEDNKIKMRQNLKDEARHIQLHQIAKKGEIKKREEMENIRDYMGHMRSLDQEEEMFQKYAQAEIADCEARGLDTRAMRKIAKPGIECGKGPLFEKRGQIRPKYYASVANPDDLPHIKKIEKKMDTKSRLGFMLP